MAQKKKHLRELLREEQEPFLLKSFIQERRGLLRRWPPISPKTQQQAHKKSALIIPNKSPIKSPLLLPLMHNPKRPASLLGIAAAAKSPTSTLNPTAACFILEAALRIQENKQKERSHSRRSIRGLGLLGSVFKRLVSSSRKPRREINQGRRDHHVTLSVKDILVWDSPHAGNCRKRIQVANCYEKRPSHGHDHGMENKEGDAVAVAVARQPDDDIHQHQHQHQHQESINFSSSSDDGRVTSSSSSSSSSSSEENGSRSVRSDESRTPELASPPHRKTEGQLVDGTRPEKEEYDEEQQQEKEKQLSPVSVLELDPTLEEEEEDHLEGHVEFYERSLAIVERSKRQLMHHLLRFQRLASLDPIELDLLLAQEEEEEEEEEHNVHQYSDADDADDAGDGNDAAGSTMLHTHNHQPEEEEEEKENHLLIMKDILGYWPSKACSCLCSLMPCPCEKAQMDMKKLTLDLIDEEKNDIKKHTTEQLDKEEALLLEKVSKRFEAWKEVVEPNTIDMMVGLDLRPESQEWEGRCKDQVREIAALIEIAIFELLLCEFSDQQLRTNDDQLQLVS